MEARRTLEITRLDQVMTEVDRLLKGHRTLGQWSLGQICHHLADTFQMAIEGPPYRLPWIVRKTVGPFIVARILKKGRFPEGIRSPKVLQPSPGLDARAEAEALRASIGYFQTYSGPMAAHPLSDVISRASWERLLCVHAAHHLGFVVPADSPDSPVPNGSRPRN